MWDLLTHFDLAPWNLVFRAVVVYLAILILVRISGKRQLGQMGATEFVAILLISNAVQNAMNGGDNSLGGGLVLAGTLILLSSVISVLTYRSRVFREIFEGTPTLLIHNGKVISSNLRRERLGIGDLKTLLRKQGLHDVHQIRTAILEADGTLTVVHADDKPIAYVENREASDETRDLFE